MNLALQKYECCTLCNSQRIRLKDTKNLDNFENIELVKCETAAIITGTIDNYNRFIMIYDLRSTTRTLAILTNIIRHSMFETESMGEMILM